MLRRSYTELSYRELNELVKLNLPDIQNFDFLDITRCPARSAKYYLNLETSDIESTDQIKRILLRLCKIGVLQYGLNYLILADLPA